MWEQAFGLASGLRAQGWDVRLVSGRYAYRVYALRPPKGLPWPGGNTACSNAAPMTPAP